MVYDISDRSAGSISFHQATLTLDVGFAHRICALATAHTITPHTTIPCFHYLQPPPWFDAFFHAREVAIIARYKKSLSRLFDCPRSSNMSLASHKGTKPDYGTSENHSFSISILQGLGPFPNEIQFHSNTTVITAASSCTLKAGSSLRSWP